MSVSNRNPLCEWLKEVKPHRRKRALAKISKSLLNFNLGEDGIKSAFNQLSRSCSVYLKRCDQKKTKNRKRRNKGISTVEVAQKASKIDETSVKIEKDEMYLHEKEDVSISHNNSRLKVRHMDIGFNSSVVRIEPQVCKVLPTKVIANQKIKSEPPFQNTEEVLAPDLNSKNIIPPAANVDNAPKIVESNKLVGRIKVRDPAFLGIGLPKEPMSIGQTTVSPKQSDNNTTQPILYHNNSSNMECEVNTRYPPSVSQDSTNFVGSNCNSIDTSCRVAQSQSRSNGNNQNRDLCDALPPFSIMGSLNSGNLTDYANQILRPQKITVVRDPNVYQSIMNKSIKRNELGKAPNNQLKELIIQKQLAIDTENLKIIMNNPNGPPEVLPTSVSIINNIHQVNPSNDQRHWSSNLGNGHQSDLNVTQDGRHPGSHIPIISKTASNSQQSDLNVTQELYHPGVHIPIISKTATNSQHEFESQHQVESLKMSINLKNETQNNGGMNTQNEFYSFQDVTQTDTSMYSASSSHADENTFSIIAMDDKRFLDIMTALGTDLNASKIIEMSGHFHVIIDLYTRPSYLNSSKELCEMKTRSTTFVSLLISILKKFAPSRKMVFFGIFLKVMEKLLTFPKFEQLHGYAQMVLLQILEIRQFSDKEVLNLVKLPEMYFKVALSTAATITRSTIESVYNLNLYDLSQCSEEIRNYIQRRDLRKLIDSFVELNSRNWAQPKSSMEVEKMLDGTKPKDSKLIRSQTQLIEPLPLKKRNTKGSVYMKLKPQGLVLLSNLLNAKSQPVKTATFLAKNQPVLSKVMNKPVKSKAIDQPVTSKAIDQPVTSKAMNQPVTSKAMDQPVTSKAMDQPVTSKAMDQPVTSKAMDQPVTSKAMDQPVTSKAMDQPVTSKAMNQPVTSLAKYQSVTPTAMNRSVISSAVNRPVTYLAIDQPVTPMAMNQPVTPTAMKQPVTTIDSSVDTSSLGPVIVNVMSLQGYHQPAVDFGLIQDQSECPAVAVSQAEILKNTVDDLISSFLNSDPLNMYSSDHTYPLKKGTERNIKMPSILKR